MKKILISYFSATGNTREAAKNIKDKLNGDLFEIEPLIPYTSEDLDWTNKESRSTKEMEDKTYRPEIKNNISNIDDYDTIVIGFPVWWYRAPSIINTFIEKNDLTNKKIYIFVTSGSSSVDSSFNDLKNNYPNLNFIDGKRLSLDNNINIDWIK